MIELGISEAQAQFTKLLKEKQEVSIIDKKSNEKKAVLLPYDEYLSLLTNSTDKDYLKDGVFSEFVGILDKSFKTNDVKYQEILKD